MTENSNRFTKLGAVGEIAGVSPGQFFYLASSRGEPVLALAVTQQAKKTGDFTGTVILRLPKDAASFSNPVRPKSISFGQAITLKDVDILPSIEGISNTSNESMDVRKGHIVKTGSDVLLITENSPAEEASYVDLLQNELHIKQPLSNWVEFSRWQIAIGENILRVYGDDEANKPDPD